MTVQDHVECTTREMTDMFRLSYEQLGPLTTQYPDQFPVIARRGGGSLPTKYFNRRAMEILGSRYCQVREEGDSPRDTMERMLHPVKPAMSPTRPGTVVSMSAVLARIDQLIAQAVALNAEAAALKTMIAGGTL